LRQEKQVVQARGKFNRETTAKEQRIIDRYNKRLERIKENVA